MDALGRRTAEMDAEDAEAAADPYGAILLHRDPSRSDAPIFEKVCSFTKEENTRYCDAYERGACPELRGIWVTIHGGL